MADNISTNKLIKALSEKIDKFQINVNSKFGKIDSRLGKVETSIDFVRMDIKEVEKKSKREMRGIEEAGNGNERCLCAEAPKCRSEGANACQPKPWRRLDER